MLAAVITCSIGLLSWGVTGHHAIGAIATNHLTPKAAAAIQGLLGTSTLADVSTWADEVRSQETYKHTGAWHYINMPLGLSYPEFKKQVESLGTENVYGAVQKCERALADNTTPRATKIEALKFLVHFVGDLHQPMHVSRSEDKGGNTIQVNYDGKGANLHSLWDSRLLEHAGLTYQQLSVKYDHLSAQQIKQWQADPLMLWIWESYGVSSILYDEVDLMKTNNIDEAYYQKHLPLIEDRIERAGIRLAGVLNTIFAGNTISAGEFTVAPVIAKTVLLPVESSVCDKVFSSKFMEGSGITLLNLGAEYPNQKLTILIKRADRSKFATAPETAFAGHQICVSGTIIDYKGKPEIIVTDPAQIKIKD